jgi:hypothetical protein
MRDATDLRIEGATTMNPWKPLALLGVGSAALLMASAACYALMAMPPRAANDALDLLAALGMIFGVASLFVCFVGIVVTVMMYEE